MPAICTVPTGLFAVPNNPIATKLKRSTALPVLPGAATLAPRLAPATAIRAARITRAPDREAPLAGAEIRAASQLLATAHTLVMPVRVTLAAAPQPAMAPTRATIRTLAAEPQPAAAIRHALAEALAQACRHATAE